jgi:membrane protease YdiL (CAAX protease family)
MIQVLLITAAVVAFGHGLERLQAVPFIFNYRSPIFAAVLLYLPIWVTRHHRNQMVFIETAPAHILKSVGTFLLWAAIIFPPYAVGVHVWAKVFWGARDFHWAGLPSIYLIAAQLLLVALPEEAFFRGYVQTRLQQIFKPRWRIFGAHLGWGWILTSILFAASHSIILYQWWHFAIFFPSLLFGYLREKTGGLIAPILFHAASNLFMEWIARCYVY